MSAHEPHLRGIGSGAGSSEPQPVSASPQQGDSTVALAAVFADSWSQHSTSTPARQSAGGPTSNHIINSFTVARVIRSILRSEPAFFNSFRFNRHRHAVDTESAMQPYSDPAQHVSGR